MRGKCLKTNEETFELKIYKVISKFTTLLYISRRRLHPEFISIANTDSDYLKVDRDVTESCCAIKYLSGKGKFFGEHDIMHNSNNIFGHVSKITLQKPIYEMNW